MDCLQAAAGVAFSKPVVLLSKTLLQEAEMKAIRPHDEDPGWSGITVLSHRDRQASGARGASLTRMRDVRDSLRNRAVKRAVFQKLRASHADLVVVLDSDSD